MHCPSFETLIDFVDGRLSTEEGRSVDGHLAGGCEECASTVAWYTGTLLTMSSDTAVDPPRWVTKRAVNLFADAKAAAERRGLRGLLSRIRASLVFDSLVGSAALEPVAMRRGASDSRQLLYSASSFDVDLLVAPGPVPDRLLVTGQVLASDDTDFQTVAGLMVELEHAGRVTAVAETSEFGEFTFREIEPGTYEVRFVSDGREIVLTEAPISLD